MMAERGESLPFPFLFHCQLPLERKERECGPFSFCFVARAMGCSAPSLSPSLVPPITQRSSIDRMGKTKAQQWKKLADPTQNATLMKQLRQHEQVTTVRNTNNADLFFVDKTGAVGARWVALQVCVRHADDTFARSSVSFQESSISEFIPLYRTSSVSRERKEARARGLGGRREEEGGGAESASPERCSSAFIFREQVRGVLVLILILCTRICTRICICSVICLSLCVLRIIQYHKKGARRGCGPSTRRRRRARWQCSYAGSVGRRKAG